MSSIPAQSLLPLDAPEPLSERVANRIRAAILSGELPPGERLSVPDLARRLGVSRTPAREALLLLERDGLVASRPRLGAEVLRGSDSDLADLLDVREALDGMAARLAAERMTADEKRALSELLDAHNRALEQSDIDLHVELDLEFHARLRDGARNPRLAKSMIEIERQTYLLMKAQSKAPGFAGRATMRDHSAIAKGVLDGNGAAAEAAARAHVERIRRFCAALAEQGVDPQAPDQPVNARLHPRASKRAQAPASALAPTRTPARPPLHAVSDKEE